jgi:hypothetical protein
VHDNNGEAVWTFKNWTYVNDIEHLFDSNISSYGDGPPDLIGSLTDSDDPGTDRFYGSGVQGPIASWNRLEAPGGVIEDEQVPLSGFDSDPGYPDYAGLDTIPGMTVPRYLRIQRPLYYLGNRDAHDLGTWASNGPTNDGSYRRRDPPEEIYDELEAGARMPRSDIPAPPAVHQQTFVMTISNTTNEQGAKLSYTDSN